MSVREKIADDLVRRDPVVQGFSNTFSSDRASYEIRKSAAEADEQVEDGDLKRILCSGVVRNAKKVPIRASKRCAHQCKHRADSLSPK